MQLAEISPNPYHPNLMRIAGFADETRDVRTLRLQFIDEAEENGFGGWQPGQFGQFTVFGAGESVFAIANKPWHPNGSSGPPTIECTFRAIGKVTNALRAMSEGQTIGFRGPYGNHFPLDDWRGKSLIFIGGGIGMAALRSAMLAAIDRKSEFGDIVILNGARTVADMVYKEEMPGWQETDGVTVVRTVDPGGETEGWDGEVGLLPNVFEKLALDPCDRIVIACGPPVMLHFLFLSLGKTGLPAGSGGDHAREQDEVRHRPLRPLLRRAVFGVQGRTGGDLGGTQRTAKGLLMDARVRPDWDIRDAILDMGGTDAYKCYQCGKCMAVCPWSHVETVLFPVYRTPQSVKFGAIMTSEDTEQIEREVEEVYRCVGCESCSTWCPHDVSMPTIMRGIRRILVEYGSYPSQLADSVGRIASSGNPFGEPRENRGQWAEALEVQAYTPDMDYLYSPCCTPVVRPARQKGRRGHRQRAADGRRDLRHPRRCRVVLR